MTPCFGRQRTAVVVVFAAIVLAACATERVPYVTVAQFARGERPVEPETTRPGVPSGSVLLRATVGEVRTSPSLLVELNDPHQEEHLWVSGFAQAPGRGREVWTAITGPPVPHDLLGSTYPSAGALSEPEGRVRVTERGALGAVLGTTAFVLVATLVLVARLARQGRGRRCPGCAGIVAAAWLTCPRCGHTLAGAGPSSEPVRIKSIGGET